MRVTIEQFKRKFFGTAKKRRIISSIILLFLVVIYRICEIFFGFSKLKNANFKLNGITYDAKNPDEIIFSGTLENLYSPLNLSFLSIIGEIRTKEVTPRKLIGFGMNDLNFFKKKPLEVDARFRVNEICDTSVIDLLKSENVTFMLSFNIKLRFCFVPLYFYNSVKIDLKNKDSENNDSEQLELSEILKILKMKITDKGGDNVVHLLINKNKAISLAKNSISGGENVNFNIALNGMLLKTNLPFLSKISIKDVFQNSKVDSEYWLIVAKVKKNSKSFRKFLLKLIKTGTFNVKMEDIYYREKDVSVNFNGKASILEFFNSKKTLEDKDSNIKNEQKFIGDNDNIYIEDLDISKSIDFNIKVHRDSKIYENFKMFDRLLSNSRAEISMVSGHNDVINFDILINENTSVFDSNHHDFYDKMSVLTVSIIPTDIFKAIESIQDHKLAFFVLKKGEGVFSMLENFFFAFNPFGVFSYGFYDNYEILSFSKDISYSQGSIMKKRCVFEDLRNLSFLQIFHNVRSSNVSNDIIVDSKLMIPDNKGSDNFINIKIPDINFVINSNIGNIKAKILPSDLYISLKEGLELSQRIRGSFNMATNISFPMVLDAETLKKFRICRDNISIKVIGGSILIKIGDTLSDPLSDSDKEDELCISKSPAIFASTLISLLETKNPLLFGFNLSSNGINNILKFKKVLYDQHKKPIVLDDYLSYLNIYKSNLYENVFKKMNQKVSSLLETINQSSLLCFHNLFSFEDVGISMIKMIGPDSIEGGVLTILEPRISVVNVNGQSYFYIEESSKAYVLINDLVDFLIEPGKILFKSSKVDGKISEVSRVLSSIINLIIDKNDGSKDFIFKNSKIRLDSAVEIKPVSDDADQIIISGGLSIPSTLLGNLEEVILLDGLGALSFKLRSNNDSPYNSSYLDIHIARIISDKFLRFNFRLQSKIYYFDDLKICYLERSINDKTGITTYFDTKKSVELFNYIFYRILNFKEPRLLKPKWVDVRDYASKVPTFDVNVKDITVERDSGFIKFDTSVSSSCISENIETLVKSFTDMLPFSIKPSVFDLNISIHVQEAFVLKYKENRVINIDGIFLNINELLDLKCIYSTASTEFKKKCKVDCGFTLSCSSLDFLQDKGFIDDISIHYIAKKLLGSEMNPKSIPIQKLFILRLMDDGMASLDLHLPFNINITNCSIGLNVPLGNDMVLFTRLVGNLYDENFVHNAFNLSLPLRIYPIVHFNIVQSETFKSNKNFFSVSRIDSDFFISVNSIVELHQIFRFLINAHKKLLFCRAIPSYYRLNSSSQNKDLTEQERIFLDILGSILTHFTYDNDPRYPVSLLSHTYLKHFLISVYRDCYSLKKPVESEDRGAIENAKYLVKTALDHLNEVGHYEYFINIAKKFFEHYSMSPLVVDLILNFLNWFIS